MISLEQIQTLNTKVQNALDVIVGLREENGTLRAKLGEYEIRMEELEVLVNSFSREQDDIENGILNILQQLDRLEEDFTSKEEVETEENTAPFQKPTENELELNSAPLSTETVNKESSSESEQEEPLSEGDVSAHAEDLTIVSETAETAAEESPEDEEELGAEPEEEKSFEKTDSNPEQITEPAAQTFEKSQPEAELDIF